MIPRFPVYLFDIDGTLLDSALDICGAVEHVLAQKPPARDISFEYLRSFIGRHLIDLFAEVYPDYSAAEIDALIHEYRTNYLSRRHQATRLYPGVVEGLAALGGRKGTATTKGSPTTRAVLEQFGLLQYFDHVQGTDGFPHKPAPDVVLTALSALGARPEDCLFVGDSAADMEAGRRAGVRICAVSYGYGKTRDLAVWAPDYWVSDLRELTS
ncbi:MAG TPA: HAD-IA family hydrolase [Bryobacteraceae bacterium]|nr:HAD-IA family hydrolase [Bryobacteraceae bacterium]